MKSQLETQLPTVPESLSSTDQCLLKSLVSTTAALSKVILPLLYNLMYVIFLFTLSAEGELWLSNTRFSMFIVDYYAHNMDSEDLTFIQTFICLVL